MRLAVALIATLAVASPASAAQRPSPSQDAFNFERRALKMAETLWHLERGSLALSWETRPEWEPGTCWAWTGEPVVHCDIDNRELRYWEPFCTAALHEGGHIAGHGHEGLGVMRIHDRVYGITEAKVRHPRRARGAAESAWQTFVVGGDWRCDRSGRPWLRQIARRDEQPRADVVDTVVGTPGWGAA